MNLKEFIELTTNGELSTVEQSPHLIFPILVNGVELDFGDISVSHHGAIEIWTPEKK